MIHRLCKVPLPVEYYMKEYKYIQEVAAINGYHSSIVDKIVKIHSNKLRNSNNSTFFLQNNTTISQKKRVSMHFVPEITGKLEKTFKRFDLHCVYKSTHKLSDLLGSTKDKEDSMKKSGIYSIKCNDCNEIYYGQTKRAIEKRYGEHIACIRLNQPNKSAFAAHVLNTNHENHCVSVVRNVRDCYRLDAYESYYIQSNADTMNLDNGNIESVLFSRV